MIVMARSTAALKPHLGVIQAKGLSKVRFNKYLYDTLI